MPKSSRTKSKEQPGLDAAPAQSPVTGRPASATSMTINWIGFIATVICWFVCSRYNVPVFTMAIATIFVFTATVAVLEIMFLKTPWRYSTGINWSKSSEVNVARVLYKTIGFYLTLAIVAFVYWVVNQYHTDAFFNNYWKAIKYFLPIVCLIQFPYFLFVDSRMRDPHDAYWMLGRWLVGHNGDIDGQTVRQHFLGWTVKGFFLPIMFADYINLLAATPFRATNFISFYDWFYNAIFTVDLLCVTVGYVFTLRIFDSHIRSTEPSMTGWVVAIVCYPPFWGGIYDRVLPYQDGHTWGPWIREDHVDPVTLFGVQMQTNWETMAWGGAILFCGYVYVWASLAFGLRFSNLTHRGIITVGPYRWTKHPAYVFKNISWWLIAIPFLPHDGGELAVRQCLMLLVVNFIYYMRARTEERHLSHDPAYVEYALWMNKHSIFSPVARVLPFLRYRQPPAIPGFTLKA